MKISAILPALVFAQEIDYAAYGLTSIMEDITSILDNLETNKKTDVADEYDLPDYENINSLVPFVGDEKKKGNSNKKNPPKKGNKNNNKGRPNNPAGNLRGDSGTPGLTCWACDEKNLDDCKNLGAPQVCSLSQGGCFVEIRVQGGSTKRVQTGCKDYDACLQNQKQNFMGPFFMMHQCKPEMGGNSRFRGASVCRQCCAAGNCFTSDGTQLGYDGDNDGTVDFEFSAFDRSVWSNVAL